MISVSFWCDQCNIDFDKNAHRETHFGEEFFEAYCDRKHKVVRYITNKQNDSYFRKSAKMKRAYIDHKKDLIQPGEEGFKKYYKKEWEKIEKANEEWEKRLVEQKKWRDDLYRKMSYNTEGKELAKKVIEADQKLSYGS